MIFGDLLRQHRVDAELSQEQLAAAAKISPRTISDLERGVARHPHGETVLRLARALRLDGAAGAELEAAARRRAPAGRPPGEAAMAGCTLPPDVASFTGRERELRQLAAAADPQRVPGIYAIGGMPGVGKTALAVHLAYLLRDMFPDRQLFIDLHAHTPGQEPLSGAAALAGLLQSIGLAARHLPTTLAERAALWRERMAGQRAVLVLDNAASSAQVTPLLPGSEDCLVLVTSRRQLGDLPGPVTPVPLDALSPEQARAMLTRLAPRAADGPPAEVAELARLAGHLPLAISLLARLYARHPAWTLAALISETGASMLTVAAERDSVAAACELSYRYLSPGQQQFFRRLGLHPGTSIDAYAAAALAGIPLRSAREQLDALYREGLLTETGYRRYGLHDLLRRYARDRSAAGSDAGRDQALGRLLDYYQQAAAAAETRLARQARTPSGSPGPAARPACLPDLPDRDRALAWARQDRGNLLACLDLVTSAGQLDRVVALTAGLAGLLRMDGPWTDAIVRHTAAVQAAARTGRPLSRADALDDLGIVLRLSGDYGGAVQAQQQALDIYRELGNRQGEANALNHLGTVWFLTDDYARAAEALELAISSYRDLGERQGLADALNHLGSVQRLTGDQQGAARNLAEALGICRDLDDRQTQANALISLGAVRRLTGDYPGAAGNLQEALGICTGLGNRQGEANALTYLGSVRQLTGDYPGAAAAHQQALDIYRELGNRLGQANAISDLGTVHRLTGDYWRASSCQHEAMSKYRDLGDRLGQGIVRYELARLAALAGDTDGAAAMLAEAVQVFREHGNRGCETEAVNEAGALHRLRGDLGQALACHQHALDLARDIGSPWNEAHALAGLGRCALAAGRPAEARASLQQAGEIFARIGAVESAAVAAELGALDADGPAASG